VLLPVLALFLQSGREVVARSTFGPRADGLVHLYRRQPRRHPDGLDNRVGRRAAQPRIKGSGD
jgi:hypothetical protein